MKTHLLTGKPFVCTYVFVDPYGRSCICCPCMQRLGAYMYVHPCMEIYVYMALHTLYLPIYLCISSKLGAFACMCFMCSCGVNLLGVF